MSISSLIRHDLVPMVVGYLLVMAALAIGVWVPRRAADHGRPAEGAGRDDTAGPHRAEERPSGHGWSAFIRHAAQDMIIGYLLLMAVVIAYYYGIARQPGDFLYSAFTGTALLMGLSAPVFAVASWLTGRRERPRPPHQPTNVSAAAPARSVPPSAASGGRDRRERLKNDTGERRRP